MISEKLLNLLIDLDAPVSQMWVCTINSDLSEDDEEEVAYWLWQNGIIMGLDEFAIDDPIDVADLPVLDPIVVERKVLALIFGHQLRDWNYDEMIEDSEKLDEFIDLCNRQLTGELGPWGDQVGVVFDVNENFNFCAYKAWYKSLTYEVE